MFQVNGTIVFRVLFILASFAFASASLTIGSIQIEGLACSQMAAGIPELKRLTGITPRDKVQSSYYSHPQFISIVPSEYRIPEAKTMRHAVKFAIIEDLHIILD